MREISVQRLNWLCWSEFAPNWERIHRASRKASFFLSREWVGCWLAIFGEDLKPELLAFMDGDELVGCCLLVWRTQLVNGVPLRRVHLNCDGEDASDSTYIEFNSLLSLPGVAKDVAEALKETLDERNWDEFRLAGAVDQEGIDILAGSFPNREISEVKSHFVDFAHLREKRIDFLNHISRNTRSRIRRVQRMYEESEGKCSLRAAETVAEGLEMFRQLVDLHQARWESLGKPGAFSSAKFYSFHERLIRLNFDRVLLVRMQAGDKIVGVLYCFVDRGWLYFYQSGISYEADTRRSPGLLTFYHALSHCLGRPEFKGFDFMAGDSQYQRSLTASSDYHTMRWIVIRRNTVPSLVYLGLRSIKRKYLDPRKPISDNGLVANDSGSSKDEALGAKQKDASEALGD